TAQRPHEPQLAAAQVLHAAPDQVRRLLAGEPREVAPVDEPPRRAPGREGGGAGRAVDPAPDDQDVEAPSVQAPEEVRPHQVSIGSAVIPAGVPAAASAGPDRLPGG